MNLIQIRYFLTLAEVLNFTKAAAACNVTQPALTKSIQKLEDELGAPLLVRDRKISQLTGFGAAMVPLLRQTYEAALAARLGAQQFLNQDQACLRLGLAPCVPAGILEPVVRELKTRFPSLRLSIREGRAALLADWLEAAEIDIAFTTSGDELTARARSWALFDEPVVAMLHAADARAEVPALSLDALPDRIAVAGVDEDGDEELGARLGVEGGGGHVAGTQEQVWTLIRAGLGAALSTARRITPPDIVRRPLDPPRVLNVRVASLAGRPANQVADACLRLVRARAWEAAPA